MLPLRQKWCKYTLKKAEKLQVTWPESSIMVFDHDELVANWGNSQHKVKISSVRKSILAILYGILLQEKFFDLDVTLEQLGINDVPPLYSSERKATLRMLLTSRSGVYHDYIGGSPIMLIDRPTRNSMQAGSRWYYNNWDFNCAGYIFEKIFNLSIPDAFIKYLAKPLGMQDFVSEDFYYYPCHHPPADTSASIYPAYHFHMTTRDMSRLSRILAAEGKWQGQQIIPSSWFHQMITSHSSAFSTICPVKDSGYGYYFWINSWPDIKQANFSARGNLGKNIIVFPDLNLSVTCMNHIAAPDDSQQENVCSYQRYPTISADDMSCMLQLLLAARNY